MWTVVGFFFLFFLFLLLLLFLLSHPIMNILACVLTCSEYSRCCTFYSLCWVPCGPYSVWKLIFSCFICFGNFLLLSVRSSFKISPLSYKRILCLLDWTSNLNFVPLCFLALRLLYLHLRNFLGFILQTLFLIANNILLDATYFNLSEDTLVLHIFHTFSSLYLSL